MKASAKIKTLGLGYVGLYNAVFLARRKEVIGFDIIRSDRVSQTN